ncbi:tyrosine-protein phosphatase siw14 [Entomophthora muscae]|uniref:Tyrosine-protein phosphatase siw14 n=2 Tax=Entomophthora muscae TaxID=34485 RepID=A0ACC2SB04_9FUNG|nr:tyrosine-protein phosphatase siw14 [Entomophthora muscae]KAJ9086374.1 tyrosine-protein phosphatase siw14 [Entomophthora muscae]
MAHLADMSFLEDSRDLLVPPLNFSVVAPGVYRSGYPNDKNFVFLKKLHLNTMLYLGPEPYAGPLKNFIEEENIRVLYFDVKNNKEPFSDIDLSRVRDALVHVLDSRLYPLLVHCNKGKYRVGCLIGCLRKLQRWSLTSIFDEYSRFAGTNFRIADQESIEIFQEVVPYNTLHKPVWF